MRTQNNYFTMPNEVFQLGLSAGERGIQLPAPLRGSQDTPVLAQLPDHRQRGGHE